MLIKALIPILPLFTALPSLAQVTATGANGPTNPTAPSFDPVGSYINQTSLSRLISLNGVDDFCLWGPDDQSGGEENLIGTIEPEVVAYCTKPRNGARIIPDGTITSAHYIKTPMYVQISGFWDGTKVGIVDGDDGGELDPHGADNLGNPIGGNATSNVEGSDVFYQEWMSFMAYDSFCVRICTAESANVTAALQCEHELDVMGCRFVMAIEDFYTSNNSFTSCEGEAAAPPGQYPEDDGSTSTFKQRYTGTWSDASTTGVYTVGETVTPTTVAYWPTTSNCVTYSTISNGVDTANYAVTATPSILTSGSTVAATDVGTTSQSAPSGISTSSPTSTSGSSGSSSGSATSGESTASASGGGSDAVSSAAGLTQDGNVVMMAGFVWAIGTILGASALL